LFVAGYCASFAHLLTGSHRICPEHLEIVEVTPDAPDARPVCIAPTSVLIAASLGSGTSPIAVTAGALHTVSDGTDGTHHDEHCWLASACQHRLFDGPFDLARLGSNESIQSDAPGRLAQHVAPIPLILLAPSHSPPLA
jgi:hypothetical protein